MTTVYQQTNNTSVNLLGSPTVVVRLRVPNTGTYLLLGRTAISLPAPAVGQPGGTARAFLTTLDGATVLDEVDVVFAPSIGQVCIALQGTLNVTATNSNEIVDIRILSGNGFGQALFCSLIAISVDQLSGSLLSGT